MTVERVSASGLLREGNDWGEDFSEQPPDNPSMVYFAINQSPTRKHTSVTPIVAPAKPAISVFVGSDLYPLLGSSMIVVSGEYGDEGAQKDGVSNTSSGLKTWTAGAAMRVDISQKNKLNHSKTHTRKAGGAKPSMTMLSIT